MAWSLIEERYTWPVRAVLLGGGSLRATSYQIIGYYVLPSKSNAQTFKQIESELHIIIFST